MQILFTRDELYETQLPPQEERLLNALMRLHPGIFTEPVYIFEDRLAASVEADKHYLNHLLIQLAQQGIIRYIPRRKTPYINWPQERLPLEYVRIPEACYELRRQRYERQIQAMLDYSSLAFATPGSVSPEDFLLNYFGETSASV